MIRIRICSLLLRHRHHAHDSHHAECVGRLCIVGIILLRIYLWCWIEFRIGCNVIQEIKRFVRICEYPFLCLAELDEAFPFAGFNVCFGRILAKLSDLFLYIGNQAVRDFVFFLVETFSDNDKIFIAEWPEAARLGVGEHCPDNCRRCIIRSAVYLMVDRFEFEFFRQRGIWITVIDETPPVQRFAQLIF